MIKPAHVQQQRKLHGYRAGAQQLRHQHLVLRSVAMWFVQCARCCLLLHRNGISPLLVVPDSCHAAVAHGLALSGRYLRPIIVRAFVAWMPRSWRPAVKVWGAVMKVRTG